MANNILDDISNALTNFASGNGPVSGWLLNTLNGPLISGFNDLTTITSGDSYFLSGTTFLASGVGFIISPMINAAEGPLVAAASAAPAVEAPAAAAAGLASSTEPQVPGATASAGGAASAALGEAKSIGSLSTPPSWGGSSPAIRLASTAVPMATLDTLPAARLGGNGFFGGLPPVASVVNAPRGGGAQPGSERSRQRARAGASDHDEAPGMPGQPRHVSVAKNTEADANRDELNTLRKALADLTRERDILKRTASFMIQEARK
uniref:PPE family protein, SVP subgroup n=1 Tax=Mycobacterium saskatchewanense TaxID=220927 RepID=UPI001E3520E4|nr:hypothetical protein [Mycobacterium saskatchewanense]